MDRPSVDSLPTVGRKIKQESYDPPMPAARPRVRAPEVRPDQILDAAQRLLLADGPSATTMDAVADAAGVGKGTIYHYYASKADLLGALRARYLERTMVAAQTAAAREPAGTVVEQIQRLVDALLDSTVGNGELIWILFHQTPGGDGDQLAAMHEVVLALVREGIAASEIDVADPEFTTQFLVHGLHGVVEAFFHQGDVDLERLKLGLRTTVGALLAPPVTPI
jgi:AcrR family transcriptional regulator